jgi:hypothetical protein
MFAFVTNFWKTYPSLVVVSGQECEWLFWKNHFSITLVREDDVQYFTFLLKKKISIFDMHIPYEASTWTLLHQNRKLSSRISLQNQLFCLRRLPAVIKIRECYAVANAFSIRNMYSLFLYMKCNSRKINRPTKNMTKIVTLLHF